MVRVLWLVPVAILVYFSRQQLILAQFPTREDWPFLKYIDGTTVTKLINDFSDWFIDIVDSVHHGLQERVSSWIINPFQNLFAETPWWIMALVLVAVAYVLGGWRPAVSRWSAWP